MSDVRNEINNELNDEANVIDGTKKRKRKTNKETVTTEMLLNRQINYTIIRNLWLVVKGEVASPDDVRNLYKYLEMSRTRYDRICGGIRATISKELLHKVKIDMQIDEGVFTGTIRLSLKININDGNKNTIDKQLVEYVNARKELRIARENNNLAEVDGEKSFIEIDKSKEEYVKKTHDKLKKLLKHYVVKQNAIDVFADENVRKLAYFIREGVTYSDSTSEQVTRISKMMDKISFRGLDDVRMNTLENYFKVLQKQYERTRIILEYKREKSK